MLNKDIFYDCSGNAITGYIVKGKPTKEESAPYFPKRDARISGSQGYSAFNTCNVNKFIDVDAYQGYGSYDLGVNTSIINPDNIVSETVIAKKEDWINDLGKWEQEWRDRNEIKIGKKTDSEELFSFYQLNREAKNKAILEHSQILGLEGFFSELRKTEMIESIILTNCLFSYTGQLIKADFKF